MEKFIQESIEDQATHDSAMGRKKKKTRRLHIMWRAKKLLCQVHLFKKTKLQNPQKKKVKLGI